MARIGISQFRDIDIRTGARSHYVSDPSDQSDRPYCFYTAPPKTT